MSTLKADGFDAAEPLRAWLAAGPNLAVKVAGKTLIVRALVEVFVMPNEHASNEETLRQWGGAARGCGQVRRRVPHA